MGNIVDTGILSLSENYENFLMWVHYTNNHRVFVIGFNSNNTFFDGVDNVTYSANRLCFDEINDSKKHNASLLYRNVFHKSIDWEYEGEWRLFKPWVKKIPSVKPNVVGLVECPIEMMNSIYIGLNASNELLDKAKKFCCMHSQLALYQAKLHQTKYSLKFSKVIL